MKVHDSPSILADWFIEPKLFLKSERKHNQETTIGLTEEEIHTKETQKALQQEKKSCAEYQIAHDNQVAALKVRFRESLHQTLKNMYRALD